MGELNPSVSPLEGSMLLEETAMLFEQQVECLEGEDLLVMALVK